MICKNCGYKITKNASFCRKCGAQVQRTGKRKYILLIIIIVLTVVAAGASAKHFFFRAEPAPLKQDADINAKPTPSEQTASREPSSSNSATQNESRTSSHSVVSKEAYYNLNIYVSNFTESGLDSFVQGKYPAYELLHFAYQQNWFNKQEVIQWAEDIWFENMYGCNTRIAKKDIDHTLQRFFGKQVRVDMLSGLDEAETYVDGYYYSGESGGNMPNGFALLTEIKQTGDCYDCHFHIYGAGNYSSSETKYYGWDEKQAKAEFGKHQGECTMRIKTKDLEDRKTYTLLEYQRLD